MKKTTLTIILLLIVSTLNAQSSYFVTAKKGLNIRTEPMSSSEIQGKLPYGTVIQEILEKTDSTLSIVDNGNIINGNWVKVKYNNYGYLVSQETEQFEKTGYIFDGYLEKLNKGSVQLDSLTKINFQELKNKAHKNTIKLRKITNLDSIKELLKDRVEWVTSGFEDDMERDDALKSIITAHGQKLIISQVGNDYGFVDEDDWSGYYPEEEILVLEGGHSSDVCFSIKTGENTETIGNPDYIISSPNNMYRLNGYFGGQECISYFFQYKEASEFKYLTEFGWDYDVCTFKEFYWLTDTTFIYSRMDYVNDSVNGEKKYFKGKIVFNK